MKYIIGSYQDYCRECRELKINLYANKEIVLLNEPVKVMGRRFTEKDEFLLGDLWEVQHVDEIIRQIKIRGGEINI